MTYNIIIAGKNNPHRRPGAGLSHPWPPNTSSAKHPPTAPTHKPQIKTYSPNKEHKGRKFTHPKITPKKTENTPNSSPVSLHPGQKTRSNTRSKKRTPENREPHPLSLVFVRWLWRLEFHEQIRNQKTEHQNSAEFRSAGFFCVQHNFSAQFRFPVGPCLNRCTDGVIRIG